MSENVSAINENAKVVVVHKSVFSWFDLIHHHAEAEPHSHLHSSLCPDPVNALFYDVHKSFRMQEKMSNALTYVFPLRIERIRIIGKDLSLPRFGERHGNNDENNRKRKRKTLTHESWTVRSITENERELIQQTCVVSFAHKSSEFTFVECKMCPHSRRCSAVSVRLCAPRMPSQIASAMRWYGKRIWLWWAEVKKFSVWNDKTNFHCSECCSHIEQAAVTFW